MSSIRKRKKISFLWNYFTVVDETFAKCNLCKVNLSYKTSITNLRKHMENKHPLEPLVYGIRKVRLTTSRSSNRNTVSSVSTKVERSAPEKPSASIEPTSVPVPPQCDDQPLRKKLKEKNDNQGLISLPGTRFQHPTNEYDKISSAWAVELQKMVPEQQLFAKKAINDILFEGQMGTLSRHSVQINTPSPTYTPHSTAVSSPVVHATLHRSSQNSDSDSSNLYESRSQLHSRHGPSTIVYKIDNVEQHVDCKIEIEHDTENVEDNA